MRYGFDDYCSLRLWRVIFVLDVLIKSSLIYLSAAVTTLGLIIMSGLEPVVPIILVGFSLSSLHFICLYIAIRFIARFKLRYVPSDRAGFLLLLVFANVLFAAILTAFLSLGGDILGSARLSMLVAATNLIPVLLVAPIAWISSLITRSR